MRPRRDTAACLPPASARIIVLVTPIVAAPTVATAPAVLEEAATAAAEVVARIDVVGRLARDEPALRLIAQHCNEFGAIVGLAAQRLVRDDDRGARQRGRRDTIEHLLWDG